ncbi:DUF6285 domain-containing protein [Pseudomonas sp. Teo4]|uniref:DUF6285 domain-containing protein n=1 Tax=Pseudomonas sp. Teo4 TaxID=3064528 RepID=UPI002ABCD46C|nr:DUF6285 domain-containing protein [Pseudomonas sp. Teo4]MDZ3993516.1 hypothetical protein [Pseudomonas sp. Teo4]
MNAPDACDLLATAREVLLTQLLPAMPGTLHYEARMVASAMLMASREIEQGPACIELERHVLAELLALPDPLELSLEQARGELARQIRQGAFDPARLWPALHKVNRAQLSISNPKVLAHD